MSIRLRTINSKRVALCAAESHKLKNDLYLDDSDHHALSEKFEADFKSMGFWKPLNKKAISFSQFKRWCQVRKIFITPKDECRHADNTFGFCKEKLCPVWKGYK